MMSPTEPTVTSGPPTPPTTVEVRDQVLWLHLRRPEVLNSINAAMTRGIHRAIDRASEPDVRAVVIRGTGRAFCAGADLDQVPGEEIDLELLRTTVEDIGAAVDRIAEFPKPVIAGVNGIAAAGGLEIVLACDLVVAARGARIADAHSNYGLLPGGGGSYRLPRRVGPALAKKLMYTGEFLTAESLIACGLVSHVVEPEQLDEALIELSNSLAQRSPRVLAAMKQLVDDAADLPRSEAAAAETAALHAYLGTPDIIEGLTAFRERRRPLFED